ncbi:hypothetical protein JL722_2289 [Aureococcus anophagefferens]|nr:hypothetical protein JL722_2289 [Aureococcus anophagefferens]
MTHAEMGAICGRFDKNASGQINGAEFQYEWSHLDAEAEAGPEEGGGFIDDGTARRGSVTRLSFGMAKIGAKTSDPGKVLRRRTSVSREQNAPRAAPGAAGDGAGGAGAGAEAPHEPPRDVRRRALRAAAAELLGDPDGRRAAALTRERSRAAPAARAPLDAVRFAPEPEPRRAEDYGGDFRAMLLDAGREKRGADALGARPATTGSPTRPATSGRADPGGGL